VRRKEVWPDQEVDLLIVETQLVSAKGNPILVGLYLHTDSGSGCSRAFQLLKTETSIVPSQCI